MNIIRTAMTAVLFLFISSVTFSTEESGRVVTQLDGFNDISKWTSARDESRINSEFGNYRFTAVPGAGRSGKGMRWDFKVITPKQSYSDLYGNFQIEEPFDRISIRVRNAAKKPISFWIKLIEEDGSDFAAGLPGVPIGNTDDWQRIEFSLDKYHVASWSKDENNTLDFPLKNVVLVATGVKPGEDYSLDFDDLEISCPGPEKVNLMKLEGPASVKAGSEISIRLTLAAGEPLRGDYKLSVMCTRDGKTVKMWQVEPPLSTSRWKPGEAVEMPPVMMHLPLFATAGTYEVHARLGWTKLARDGKETLMQFAVEPRKSGPIPKVAIRPHNGVPTLFINDKPNAAMTYMTYNRQEHKYFRDFGEAGVDLATFSATSDYSYYSLAPPTWLAPDIFDFSHFDDRIIAILEANPNAYLFPRIYISAPPWWCEAYPDEVAKQAEIVPSKGDHFSGKPFATPASEKWRKDTAMALRKFIEHIRSSPYADRVIGYHIASLHTEEWFYHNFWGNPPSYWGYSKPDIESFRKWLKKRYGNIEALRRAWHDGKVDFSAVVPPRKAERLSTDLGFFRDPAKSRRIIDFYIYYNDIMVDTIEYFARVVKEATNRESIFGVFYGYVFELSGSPEGGHMALERLLRSPDVDFLTAPSSYAFRALGTGCSTFMSLTEAIKLHGKLWFNENDYRTHLMPQKKGVFDAIDLNNLDESISIQKRELGLVLSLGTGMWWFDMGGGWYDEPGFMKAIAEMNDVGERSIAFDRSSAAEIAVVVDEESMCFGDGKGRFANLLLGQQRKELHRLGAPFDFVFLSDLESLRPYKMYIFLNTFKLDQTQRGMIDKTVKKDGKVVVWVYASGFVDGTLSDEGITQTTGIKVTYTNDHRAVKIKITDKDDDLTKGAPEDTRWGSGDKLAPIFYCTDKSAKVLGMIDGFESPGLAVKRFPEWTSVYCAAPNLPWWLLRSMAKSAGVHIYNDAGDVMYLNKSFLTIHANEAGQRILRFSKPVSLFEVFERRQVATDVMEVKVDLPAKHTAIYLLGTAEQWKKAGKGD
ncbi:MAG: beta-galactosidase [Kiritimatiellae bacterium]|nr:beta-galactosidase [Kiritimatiellia bacterium]MDD5523209.1 beta-galactosidase [Kiritimatiellia bacterium]